MPIWAELSEAAGYASAAAVVCTGIISGTIALVKLFDHSRLSAKQQRRIDLLEASVGRLQREHGDCREQLAEVFTWGSGLHDAAAAAVRRSGGDPDKELPPKLRRREGHAAEADEFTARTLAQQATLLTPPRTPPAGGA